MERDCLVAGLGEMAAEPRVINPDGSIEPRKIDVARPKLDKVIVQRTSPMSHFAVAEAWKNLGIEDKEKYLIVTSTLHTVTNKRFGGPEIDDQLEFGRLLDRKVARLGALQNPRHNRRRTGTSRRNSDHGGTF
jgi:hypothetical protein